MGVTTHRSGRWLRAIPVVVLLFAFRPAWAGLDSNSTVFIILMENHNWSQFHGGTSAPYINNTLLPMASRAEQYYNPPGLHPSLPNYLWLEAGQNFGIFDDNPPSSDHQSTTNHFVTQLKNAGISWRAYQENIAGTACPLTDNYPYAVRHDPFVYFDDVTGNQNPNSTYCIAEARPYTELANDLSNNTVARYNFITPNVCNDGHDSCAPVSDPVRQTDNWLASNLPMILNSQAYKNGGVILITWDEGSGSDGPIGMIVLSPYAKASGYNNSIHYTHSSTLRTFQKIFGVRPLLNDAANATDLSDLLLPGAIPNADAFALDGTADSTNFLQNAGPMVIYAAVRGTTLYVATWSPGANNAGANDHFVIVTDQLSPTLQPAFPAWSKTGMNAVDPSKPFLAGESSNGYVGWQNTTAATLAYKTPTNSGLMEGTIDLVQAFGPGILTGKVYIAAAAYATANGGGLAAQGPPGNGNGNIESNEFLAISLANIRDDDFDGVDDSATPGQNPFSLDGNADSTNFVQNTGPMVIYAGVRGTTLYVATWSPGNNNVGANDHFVIVTDQLSPTLQSAFPTWSKSGMNAVDPGKPFLGGESINTYVGWQNATATNHAYKSATTSGLLEGTIDLVQASGPSIMTGTVYIAAAAYGPTNGGALVAQGPPGNGNGNIESNEFLAVHIAALLDNNSDGVYDRLDPNIGFHVSSTQASPGGAFIVTWNAEPGRNYQVQFTDSLTLSTLWQDLPGGQTNAASGQLTLSLTDTTAPGAANRFYRVKLLGP